MRYSPYSQLDKLISEYYEVSKIIRDDRLIIKNYPKVLLMSIASKFEVRLKEKLKDFYISPQKPISTEYPEVYDASQHLRTYETISDKLFKKLVSSNRNGIERLDASDFYKLFGTEAFKSALENNFEAELTTEINEIDGNLNKLIPLLGTSESLDEQYARYDGIRDVLDSCSFNDAEKAFLSLKLRRNNVAHDYMDGLSDTFSDICNFYYKAVLFVISLETAIESLINRSA